MKVLCMRISTPQWWCLGLLCFDTVILFNSISWATIFWPLISLYKWFCIPIVLDIVGQRLLKLMSVNADTARLIHLSIWWISAGLLYVALGVYPFFFFQILGFLFLIYSTVYIFLSIYSLIERLLAMRAKQDNQS